MSTMALARPDSGRGNVGSATLFSDLDRSEPVAPEGNSTLLTAAQRPAWLPRALAYLLEAIARRKVDGGAAVLAGEWLLTLPEWVPKPSVGIGDDGSVSIEWDRAGAVLHVMFDHETAEAYFADSKSNTEWEISLTLTEDAGPLLHALRVISLPRQP